MTGTDGLAAQGAVGLRVISRGRTAIASKVEISQAGKFRFHRKATGEVIVPARHWKQGECRKRR